MASLISCSFCKETTKYSCIICGTPACLRPECSVFESEEETPGWEQFKTVGYCLQCRIQPLDSLEKGSDEDETPWNGRDKDAAGTHDTYGSSSQSSAHGTPQPRSNGNQKRSGRKWHNHEISDMVDIIVNSKEFTRNLIFTNTKKHKNTEIYEAVLAQLNGKYKEVHGQDFPYKVDQLRNKFKWCVGICKKACLTINTATGIKRFVNDKDYGEWFTVLYPLIKSRDSCQPDRAVEPSADGSDGDSDTTVTTDISGENDANGDKTLFVPVKKARTSKRQKIDPILQTHELLKKVIENDPTKDLLLLMKEELKQSREQDNRYFQMLCGMMSSAHNTHLPQNQMFFPPSNSQAPSPSLPHAFPNVPFQYTPYALDPASNAIYHNTAINNHGSETHTSRSISPESQPQYQQL